MVMEKLSSLELMLERIQQMEDQPEDVPPVLPTRPVTRGRLPRSRMKLQFSFFQRSDGEENGSLDRVSSLEESKIITGAQNDLASEVRERESTEITGVPASALQIKKSVEEIIEGYENNCRNNLTGVIGKVRKLCTLYLFFFFSE